MASARPKVSVDPRFFVLCAVLIGLMWGFAIFAQTRLGWPIDPLQDFWWAVAVIALYVGSDLCHELGHVAAAQAVGHRWTKLMFTGLGVAVECLPSDPHGWHRITRSIAGPALHMLVSAAMMSLATLEDWSDIQQGLAFPMLSAVWVAGIAGLFDAVWNLLPVKGFDGYKVLLGVKDLLDGRGSTSS